MTLTMLSKAYPSCRRPVLIVSLFLVATLLGWHFSFIVEFSPKASAALHANARSSCESLRLEPSSPKSLLALFRLVVTELSTLLSRLMVLSDRNTCVRARVTRACVRENNM